MSTCETKRRKRRLRIESLEERALLSVTVFDETFKTMDAAGTLALSGTFKASDWNVSGTWWGSAHVRGSIEYDSPEHGVGWGTGAGKATWRAKIFGRVRTGKITFSGSGAGVDNNGIVTGTGSGSATVTTPLGPAGGEGSGDGEGTFNASKFTTAGSASGDAGIGTGTVRWNGPLRPTDPKPFDVAIAASWADPQRPEDGVFVSVNVSGKVHNAPTVNRQSARGVPVSNVELYWARGATFAKKIGSRLSDRIPIYWNQASGSYTVDNLPLPPAGATHLLLAAKFDGNTRLVALRLQAGPTPSPPPAQDSYISVDRTCWLPDAAGKMNSYTGADLLHLTSDGSGQYGYEFLLDGSDVGLNAGGDNIDAFALLPDGSILVSTSGTYSVQAEYNEPGVGTGNWLRGSGEDILRFAPTSTGTDSTGTWELYFDGSDVKLNGSAGNVDALAVLPDGNLLISVTGSPKLPGIARPVKPADVVRFVPASLGDETAGAWSLYFRGADVGLTTAGENVDAISVTLGDSLVPTLLLSTRGVFSAGRLSGGGEDVFAFTFTSQPGAPTRGTFASELVVDGSRYGLAGLNLDGFVPVSPAVGPAYRDVALEADLWGPAAASESDLALSALGYETPLQKCKSRWIAFAGTELWAQTGGGD
jgi:hypothetical protein